MSEFRTPRKTVNHNPQAPAKDAFDSSSDEDGYLSSFNCSEDGGTALDGADGSLLDEMPPFSAFSLSPSARSLSPIEMESFDSEHSTPKRSKEFIGCSTPIFNKSPTDGRVTDSSQPAEGFVSLDEIHARIGLTPPDSHKSRSRLNLETIFEGVFLETPPKKEFQSTGNLLRRSIKNRALQFDKVDHLKEASNVQRLCS
ncbi:uncharacterized protein LOC118460296 [Anopheles albimanus]|uniref:uncharacterized protein LOC118460296 n=1 Tax=Anopheles albimanus TaxID=7167 RepID=UPI00163F1B96|nr:uncharacterized protein LOC118460296 [Anopheles albimanus]